MSKELAEKIIEHVGSLTLCQGDAAGGKFEVLPWQRKFIRGAFAPGITQAVACLARGNGKSALISGIATAGYLPDGPLVQPNGEIVCVGSSFTQARIIFDACLWFSKPWFYKQPGRWRINDSINKVSIKDLDTGAKMRCIASDPKRVHGITGGVLFICDEVAQWPPTISEKMREALVTAQGKHPGSRLLAIGTKPTFKDDWFSKMLDQEIAGIYRQLHTAEGASGEELFNERTWEKANPSLNKFPSLLQAIKSEAKRARKDETERQSFKTLRLNMGGDDAIENYLLDPESWESIEGDAPPEGEKVWGVDLGTSKSFSCISCAWESGRMEVIAAAGDNPSIENRATNDNCPPDFYKKMVAHKELYVMPGRVINLADFIDIAVQRFGQPEHGIICDSWRIDEFQDAASASSLFLCEIHKRRQDWLDQGQDIRDFKRAVLTGSVTPVQSFLMRSALGDFRTIKDDAANEKIVKGRGGRDNALVASLFSMAYMQRHKDRMDSNDDTPVFGQLDMSL